MTARQAALESLLRCDRDGKFSNLELGSAISRHALEGKEKGLYTALLYGVIQRRTTLDYLIGSFSRVPISKMDPPVLQILRMGIYQILYLDRIPDSAACNESVELCKTAGFRSAAPLVNAVLRQTVRKKEDLPFPNGKDISLSLSVRYGFPNALTARFLSVFGQERTASLLDAFNRPVPVTLRINTLRTDRETLLTELLNEGIAARPSSLTDSGILLDGTVPVSDLACLAEGRCFVQDEASQFCASLLGAEPGMTVIDCCACPGGKSFSLAMQMQNRGRLFSFDLHRSKLSLLENGAERLGISILTARETDGTKGCEELFGKADRVLCDVPCSGYGVIAKKPDLRHKDPSVTDRLPAVQSAILQTASRYLRPGGDLVYSTCTVFPEENDRIVDAFLAANPAFSLQYRRTFYPDTDGTDGFFTAKLHRCS